MRTVKINIIKRLTGFSKIDVDGKYIGELEDMEDSVEQVIRNLVRAIPIENTEVIIKKGK